MTDPSPEPQVPSLELRLRKWSVPVTTDGPLSAEKREEIRAFVRGFRETHGIALEQIARGIGGSNSYVSQALGAKIPDHLADPILRQINDWCEQHGEALACRVPTKLVMIRPAERLYLLAKRVKALRDIGVGYGPAGIGKTLTARYIADKLHGVYVLCTHRHCSPTRLFAKIYAALHRSSMPIKRIDDDDLLCELGGSDRLLIIDQAHKLNLDAVEALCDLHEAGQMPVLLIGTRDILDLVRADAKALLGQVSSRVGLRRDLLPEVGAAGGGGSPAWVTFDEMREMFERGPIKLHAAVVREAAGLVNDGRLVGLLRTIGKIIANAARDLSQTGGGPVTVTLEAFNAAFRAMDDEARILLPTERIAAVNPRKKEASA